ncbi:tripartite tricarboxylate transporter TctB family protein [Jannaschia sp. 2305UL9-9]|uniref:tripartite tricarboxylate transporter TctB family protein n=1 Tax=Jannaschia sp. 2305UL9-9 TaxID=3121638 RepID=UPI003529A2C0
MTLNDRTFGAVVVLGAVAYAAAALQLQTGFMTDPVGSKTFPLIVAGVCALCGLVMMARPDDAPDWPMGKTLLSLLVSVAVLAGYAYAIKPLGFMIPTAIAAGVLSYQIEPKAKGAVIAGLGLSVGLFVIFKFVLGLGLTAFPGL